MIYQLYLIVYLTISLILIVNDYLDIHLAYLEKKHSLHYKQGIKLICHILVIFLVFIVTTYLLWIICGWGGCLTE